MGSKKEDVKGMKGMDVSNAAIVIGVTLAIIATIAAASLLASLVVVICWNLVMMLLGLSPMGSEMVPTLAVAFGVLFGGITFVCFCIMYRTFDTGLSKEG